MSEIQIITSKLLNADIIPNERIAILSDNSPQYANLVIACWKIGIVVVPISIRYPNVKIVETLQSINCNKILLAPTQQLKNPNIEIFQMDDFVSYNDCQFILPDFASLSLDLNAHASIIFTSATSDAPKAVLHTIANHYYSALGSAKNIPFAKNDKWLMSLPMTHISGFSLIMRSLINQGTIIFPENKISLADAILNYNLTHLSLVATQLTELLKKTNCINALKKLKAILIGGSAIPQSLIEEALSHNLNIYTTYGSTELASQITTTTLNDIKNYKNTSGEILDYRQIKIADDGEILTKGKTLSPGYVKYDSIISITDSQGYFHTGDMGYIKNNNLSVTGRKDLMFISGGENIYPEEIERAIQSIDNIVQAIVVPIKDDTFGQRPIAFIKNDFDPEYIEKQLQTKIESFKIPIVFYPWPNFKQSSIKLNRRDFANYAAKLMNK